MTVDPSDNVHAKLNVEHGKKKLTRKVKKMNMENAISFRKDKETKNKVRFTADMPDVQGSIYVSKDSPLAERDEILMEVASEVAEYFDE